MNLKDSMSKLTNTIEESTKSVAKTLESGANKVAKKSGVLVEISKLNINVASEEEKAKNLYEQLGKAIFEDYTKGHTVDEAMIGDCNDILEIEKNIKELKVRINILKNIKKCPNCDTEMKLNTVYCPKCGAKQENYDDINIDKRDIAPIDVEYKETNEDKDN